MMNVPGFRRALAALGSTLMIAACATSSPATSHVPGDAVRASSYHAGHASPGQTALPGAVVAAPTDYGRVEGQAERLAPPARYPDQGRAESTSYAFHSRTAPPPGEANSERYRGTTATYQPAGDGRVQPSYVHRAAPELICGDASCGPR